MDIPSLLTLGTVAITGVFTLAVPVSQPANNAPVRQSAPVSQSGYNGGLTKQVKAIKAAIIGQESGNDPGAVNPHSGALGYAQVMPANVPQWSKQALGYSITPSQFLANPELQHKIINHKLMEYWDVTGNYSQDSSVRARMVASIWYSGWASLYNNKAQQWYNGHRYPSISEYTLSALYKAKAYGLE